MAKFISLCALCVSLLIPAIASAAALDDYYLSRFGEKRTYASAVAVLAAPQTPQVERCRTELIRSLKRDFTHLEAATQKVLAPYVSRPVLSGQLSSAAAPTYKLPNGHFTVHYTTTGADAPDLTDLDGDQVPDWVEKVASVFEDVYSKEVVEMGYKAPPVSTYDVYLRDLITRDDLGNITNAVYGYTTHDVEPILPNVSVSSYIEIDKAFSDPILTQSGMFQPDQMLMVTAAHEYQHAIQYGYNLYFEFWYAEITSTWMEDEVFDSVNQLYGYLGSYLYYDKTSVALNAVRDGASEYGRWIFNRSLAEEHNTPVLIRRIWERLAGVTPVNASTDINMVSMIEATLHDSYNSSFSAEFSAFLKKLYKREWPTRPADLARIVLPTMLDPLASQIVTLPRYSFAFYRFVPSNQALAITLKKTSGVETTLFKKINGVVTEIPLDAGASSYTVSDFAAMNPLTDEVVLLVANTTVLDGHQVSFSTDGSTLAVTEPKVAAAAGGGGGCFIATAAYGSYLHPKVAELRAFRDQYLLTNAPGRLFVSAYYRLSPPIADVIARHEWMKSGVRGLLLPLIFAVEHPMAALGLLLVVVGASLRWGMLVLKGRGREAAAA
ncbi:MXAN_6640 family putative metalloprotease [Geomonas propionica]|uniref:Peptidase MA-like domain-containing protein n=1 Tax=Geomonas propionica TaxID=2798582 RepID=A0ABS0YN92_9BACT|nr:MXAN_6640 family putative metalloprotease [Geomonas propionica]MBJ6799389.1 hypothetical protein [Geomonas propionica]